MWCRSTEVCVKGDCHGCECSRQQSLIEALQRGALVLSRTGVHQCRRAPNLE